MTEPTSAPAADAPGGVQTRPLAMAILACASIAVATAMLSPDLPGAWYDELVRPVALLPPVVYALLVAAFYVVFAIVLYRSQVHLAEPARRVVLGLTVGVMLIQAAWSPLLARLESLEAGVAMAGIVAGGMVTLVVILASRERTSALLLAPYMALALHDFWWARELARLNGG